MFTQYIVILYRYNVRVDSQIIIFFFFQYLIKYSTGPVSFYVPRLVQNNSLVTYNIIIVDDSFGSSLLRTTL